MTEEELQALGDKVRAGQASDEEKIMLVKALKEELSKVSAILDQAVGAQA